MILMILGTSGINAVTGSFSETVDMDKDINRKSRSFKSGSQTDCGTENNEFVIKNIRREKIMAEPTGLEPATSDVTGRRSNQLNYDSA